MRSSRNLQESAIRSILASLIERIRFSFWFIPALLAVAAILLSILTVRLDEALSTSSGFSGPLGDWLYSGSAQGAGSVLTTIASSMITIAGVVFSMTLVALTLASSQFGPRLLRNFMGDRSTQVVLGTFVATFLFCLLVLRTILHGEDDPFVPHLSVTVAVLLAVIDMGVLIHFIHHVALSIQGDRIIARTGRELISAVERLVPEPGQAANPRDEQLDIENNGADQAAALKGQHAARSRTDGYLQFIDEDGLLRSAAEQDAVVRLLLRPGQYAARGSRLAVLDCPEDKREQMEKAVQAALSLDYQPSSAQDVEHGMRQLVEVALRALSPGVNEPFTAVHCLDRLGSALCLLAGRDLPAERLRYMDGQLRLILPAADFGELCSLAFDQIRLNLRGDLRLCLHMLATLGLVLDAVDAAGRREVLRQHVRLVRQAAGRDLSDEADLQRVENACTELEQ
ncbi:DUF2254 domain-containing protein [bacterium]|nr:DUF2254 domain-containing protein [bacterium]